MPRADAPCAKPKIAVLGASGSLGGEACALAAQLLDADMLIAGRNREALEKVSAALPRPAAVVTADLHSLSGEAVEAFSTCDVLLNCTGPSWKNAAAAALCTGVIGNVIWGSIPAAMRRQWPSLNPITAPLSAKAGAA